MRTAVLTLCVSRAGEPMNLYYSTSSIQNQLFEEYLRVPQLKVYVIAVHCNIPVLHELTTFAYRVSRSTRIEMAVLIDTK